MITPTDISDTVIETLSNYFELPPHEVVEKIQRDTRYHSRYNVVLKDPAQKARLVNEGIVINGLRIRGKTDKFRTPLTKLYVPNFPVWGTEQELRQSLLDAGIQKVAYARERLGKKFSIPIGGWNVGVVPSSEGCPDFVTFEGANFTTSTQPSPKTHIKHQPHTPQNNHHRQSRILRTKPKVKTKPSLMQRIHIQ